MPWLVLDTSLLLGGKDPPRGPSWATTPEASAEIKPGGADARRFANWVASGLEVRDPSPASVQTVRNIAVKAGNLARLSEADVSLAALAMDLEAILVTDDYTLLDVAKRLGIQSQTVNTHGIEGTLDFKPRCTGCGRWFDEMPKREECIVCGSPVKPKPRTPPAKGPPSPQKQPA